MRSIGPSTREENVTRLAGETFDVLVIGGGITGAGCAMDAASRGLKTALIERHDFASGTSSKSSKLVHGGLRYLAQYEFGLTWEAAHERDLLARIAPNLVRPVHFMYPVFRKGRDSRFASVGLSVYDVLSAVRGVPRHRRANESMLRAMTPAIDPGRVVAAWTYWDALTDDARLVWEVLRAAHSFGAVMANYVEVRHLEANNGRTSVAHVFSDQRSLTIKARVIVNATGVWAGNVESLEQTNAGPFAQPDHRISIRPAKGIHLVVSADRLPLGSAAIVPSGAHDRRSLFAIPWLGRVLLGTTDTEYAGSFDHPSVDANDLEYVLAGINKWMDVGLTPSDVLTAYAGLRPLRGGAQSSRTADLSRKHAISVSSGGLVSVTGGKLTTFRRMARDAIDAACEKIGERRSSTTHRLRIGLTKPAAAVEADVADLLQHAGIERASARRLVDAYGDVAPEVAALAAEDETLSRSVAPGLGVMAAEIVWAARHEMSVHLDDALARRTRLALLDPQGGLGGSGPAVFASVLGWDSARLRLESERYQAALIQERGAAATSLSRTPSSETQKFEVGSAGWRRKSAHSDPPH